MSTNKELLNQLDLMKKEPNAEVANKLTQMLDEINVFLPAVMPRNTDPAILRQMAASPKKPQPIPQGAKPTPCILQNEDGRKFFPMFTSEEEIEKGRDKILNYPITINMPFKTCMDMVLRSTDIEGAVINPFSHNIIMNIDRNKANEDKKEAPKPIKLTEPQFHAMVRQQMESNILPRKIFAEGEPFIKDLRERGGECLIEFFEEPYAQTKNCPYSADDYDLMSLSISDTLELIRITMPEEKLYPGTAITLFVTWNPVESKAGYYGILRGSKGERNKLMEITSEGKAVDHGDAPDEGSELSSIIDIASEKYGV